jgi:hypothetical protein
MTFEMLMMVGSICLAVLLSTALLTAHRKTSITWGLTSFLFAATWALPVMIWLKFQPLVSRSDVAGSVLVYLQPDCLLFLVGSWIILGLPAGVLGLLVAFLYRRMFGRTEVKIMGCGKHPWRAETETDGGNNLVLRDAAIVSVLSFGGVLSAVMIFLVSRVCVR